MMRHRGLFGFNRPVAGQSMTEYAFAGALIFAVCIGVLVLVGTNLNKFGKEYTAEVQAATGDNVAFLTGAGGGRKESGIGGKIPPPGKGEEQVCFKSGYCVNLPKTLTSRRAEASGNNGGELTLAMSRVLRQILAQMNADPNADPEIKRLITKLARNGHTLGDAEKIIDGNKTVQKALKGDGTVTIYDPNNKTDRKDAALDRKDGITAIGSARLEDALDTIRRRGEVFDATNKELNAYLAKNPGALDPGLAKLIQLESQEISDIAYYGYTSSKEDFGSDSGASYADEIGDGVVTKQDSNNICNTGGAGCVENPY